LKNWNWKREGAGTVPASSRWTSTYRELKAELRRFGYVVHVLSPEGLRPTEEADQQPETVCDYFAAKELSPQIVSDYTTSLGKQVWIISRLDRGGGTTVLLPE